MARRGLLRARKSRLPRPPKRGKSRQYPVAESPRTRIKGEGYAHSQRTLKPIAIALALAFTSTGAFATDGYFAEGYGMRARGMGGASIATALDAFGGANNPASMAFVGNRLDLGIYWFSPDRGAERTGSMPSLNGSATSDSKQLLHPRGRGQLDAATRHGARA